MLYACAGCDAFGQTARELALRLDRAGRAEAAWLGTPGVAPKARFPIVALDGCADACALQWLARRGIRPERHYVLPADVERLAADLA